MDALLFVASLSVQPYLKRFLTAEIINSSKSIEDYSPAAGWLYITVALTQGLGALLVHKQVSAQLQLPHRPSYQLFPLIALIIMHFAIFGILFWIDGIKYIWHGHMPFWADPVMFFPIIAAALVIIPTGKPVPAAIGN